MKTKTLLFLLSAFLLLPISSCDEEGNFSIFSVEDDIKLGQQLATEIAANPTEYPVMSETEYPEAYGHIRRILENILDNADIPFEDRFAYREIKLIDQDVLNAFAAPGGYIYVYTGLIKYLDTEDQLAGVLGHEIAHAAQRHGSQQMQKQLGVQFLLELVLGKNAGLVSQALTTLAALSFSRSDEAEADDFSVEYLAPTQYQCNGAAGFFVKIAEAGGSGGPEFLSTHPNPANRVEDINAKASEEGCSTVPSASAPDNYAAFKASLP